MYYVLFLLYNLLCHIFVYVYMCVTLLIVNFFNFIYCRLQHDVASSKRVAFQVGGDLNRDDYSTNENTHSDGKEDDSDSDYSGVINDTNCSDDDDDDGSYDGAVDEDDYSDIPSEDDDIDEEHPEECASGDKKIATSIMKSQKSDIEVLLIITYYYLLLLIIITYYLLIANACYFTVCICMYIRRYDRDHCFRSGNISKTESD